MVNRGYAPIVVAVFGVSTPHAYWAFNVVFRIVEAITGPTTHLHIASLEQLREGFGQRNGGSVVVTADLPDTDLASFVCASELPQIVIGEELAEALAWTRVSRKVSVTDAVRFCSLMLSTLAPAFMSPHALIIDGRRDESSESIVASMIDYLFPGRGEWLAIQTFEHLMKGGHVLSDVVVDRSQYRGGEASAGATDQQIEQGANLAVASYSDLLAGRWPSEIVWPLELFRRLDDRPPDAPIELTGPARTLLFGPYLYLPAGDWIARVEFEIAGALSGVEALADVRVNDVVTERAFDMPANGIFAYDLDFRVEDPHHDVEIRLFMKKSAIEGVFLPRSVKVRPRPRES